MSQVSNKWGWLWVVVLGSGLIGCSAGSTADGMDGATVEEQDDGGSDSGDVSDIPYNGSVESAVNEYFPLTGISQQENGTRQAASECPTYPSGADKSFSNTVAAGHYGRPSTGVSLLAAVTCDASNAATAWQSWRIVDTSTIDCDGLSLDFQGGTGILAVGELHDLAIYGTFTLSGVSVHCDIVFGVQFQPGGSGDMSVSCETDDGTAVSGGEDDPQCSISQNADDSSGVDDDGPDEAIDEGGFSDDGSTGYDDRDGRYD